MHNSTKKNVQNTFTWLTLETCSILMYEPCSRVCVDADVFEWIEPQLNTAASHHHPKHPLSVLWTGTVQSLLLLVSIISVRAA